MKPTVSWIPWRNSDLRSYLSHARLPEMAFSERAPESPRDGFKSHRNNLTVTHETFRQLESIRRILSDHFAQNIARMLDIHVPKECLTLNDVCDYDASGDRLTVPATNFKINIPEYPLRRPENIAHITNWLENYPLATVQRAIHLMYPGSTEWVCKMDESQSSDQDIFRYFTWSAPSTGSTSRAVNGRQASVVIVYQPPWILSTEDITRFMLCDSHPSWDRNAKAAFHSKHKLWAKIWDLCFANMCTYFVLTNYDDWVFGNFSLGWSNAYVTRPIKFSDSRPTVMETLAYWFASSMGKSGGWAPLSLPESVALLDLPTRITPAVHHSSDIPSSESEGEHWPPSIERPGWDNGRRSSSRTSSETVPAAARAILRPLSRCSSASSACGEDADHTVGVIRTNKLTRIARKTSVAVPSRRLPQRPPPALFTVPPVQEDDLDGLHNDLPIYCGNTHLIQPTPLRAGLVALLDHGDVPAASGDAQSTTVGPTDMVPQDSLSSDIDVLLGAPPKDRTMSWIGNQSGHAVDPARFAGFLPPIASPAPSNFSDRSSASNASNASTVRDLFSSIPTLQAVELDGAWTAQTVSPFAPTV